MTDPCWSTWGADELAGVEIFKKAFVISNLNKCSDEECQSQNFLPLQSGHTRRGLIAIMQHAICSQVAQKFEDVSASLSCMAFDLGLPRPPDTRKPKELANSVGYFGMRTLSTSPGRN
ncbi:hypothetical protein TWF694_010329 [Orbilia ellipsospora]|uniref:Uncharacterized protein n=1 Tax=Orbilia ellipsospora TaxID=2528407 RepID=A0AAV9XAG8_9PEZI